MGVGSTKKWLCSAALLATALAGCTQRIVTPYDPSDRTYVYTPPVPDPYFEYSEPAKVTLASTEEETRRHRIERLSFPAIGPNGHEDELVEALFFQSKSPGPKKVVIVLPIWGANDYPSEKISEGYAKHSKGEAHVVRILGDHRLINWEELAAIEDEDEFVRRSMEMQRNVRNMVVDVSRLIDWLETRPEIDESRVALVGFSMGAIAGAIMLGNEPRFGTGVLMMGGADYGKIFASCNGKVGLAREHVLSDFGWTLAQYEAFFSELYEVGNPARYAGHYNPERTLMIDAWYDDCVPGPSRELLWESLGYPERISFLYTHKKAFLSMTPLGFNYTRHRIYDFLDEKL